MLRKPGKAPAVWVFTSYLLPILMTKINDNDGDTKIINAIEIFTACHVNERELKFLPLSQPCVERLSEKVNATIPKVIVGGFEYIFLQRNLREWLDRQWTYLCEG